MRGIAKAFNHSVIPAAPGWCVVVPVYGGAQKIALDRMPVIAWLISIYCIKQGEQLGEAFTDLVPIVPAGSMSDVEYALQFDRHPPFYTTHQEFDDEAALVAYFASVKPKFAP